MKKLFVTFAFLVISIFGFSQGSKISTKTTATDFPSWTLATTNLVYDDGRIYNSTYLLYEFTTVYGKVCSMKLNSKKEVLQFADDLIEVANSTDELFINREVYTIFNSKTSPGQVSIYIKRDGFAYESSNVPAFAEVIRQLATIPVLQ